ncbi:unnamed protein product [Lepeophtheirus salmonis]|uniref:(salmon louse) hypothetical protein n=1 Tax=Lepeophtheirus salmonis TaxID=72036 RepID=A0A817FH30_LEPSM|nr:unnamed protein product [Lepeophtheirus salmonis]
MGAESGSLPGRPAERLSQKAFYQKKGLKAHINEYGLFVFTSEVSLLELSIAKSQKRCISCLLLEKEEHWQNTKELTRVFTVNIPQNLIHRRQMVHYEDDDFSITYQHEGSILKKVSGQSSEILLQD